MPLNGTVTAVVSANALKKDSESALKSALLNANEEAIKQDRPGKKSPHAKVNPKRKK